MFRSVPFLLVLACVPTGGAPLGPHQPTLAEVSATGDAATDLVDRASVLSGAAENAAGLAPDLGSAPDAFFLQIDGQELKAELDSAAGRRLFPTYFNVLAASGAVVVADLATVAVVGPPAAAIAFAGDGVLIEVTPWFWTATNTAVAPNGASATVHLNVAWVGVGWLAEMRLTSSDGAYNDTLWFNGFLSESGGVGWWDLYANGEVAGVVEWIAGSDGSYEAAIAAVTGDGAGDVLAYLGAADGTAAVSFWDASAAYQSYVLLNPDQSGEVALVDYNGGLPACWNTTWADVACE